MLFRPDQPPRAVFPRKFSADFVGSIMARNSVSEVIRVADVKVTSWILENVNEEHTIGSSGRIRTYDQSVNSRPLYH
jgi:hypothetical protein